MQGLGRNTGREVCSKPEEFYVQRQGTEEHCLFGKQQTLWYCNNTEFAIGRRGRKEKKISGTSELFSLIAIP